MFIRYYTRVVIGCSRLPGALRDSVSIRVSDGNIIITSSYDDHRNNIDNSIMYFIFVPIVYNIR